MSQSQEPSFIGKNWKLLGGLLAGVATIIGIVTGIMTIMQNLRENISASEAIRLDYTLEGIPGAGVVRDFDPDRGFDYYVDEGKITYSAPKIDVEVTSQADEEWIKMAPYLVIEVTDIKPMPDNLEYIFVGTLVDEVRYSDWFCAIITPERDGEFAAMRFSDFALDSSFDPI